MKKNYITPVVEVIRIEGNDFLAASTPEYDGPFYSRDLEDF